VDFQLTNTLLTWNFRIHLICRPVFERIIRHDYHHSKFSFKSKRHLADKPTSAQTRWGNWQSEPWATTVLHPKHTRCHLCLTTDITSHQQPWPTTIPSHKSIHILTSHWHQTWSTIIPNSVSYLKAISLTSRPLLGLGEAIGSRSLERLQYLHTEPYSPSWMTDNRHNITPN
jgi:hypothetical protein